MPLWPVLDDRGNNAMKIQANLTRKPLTCNEFGALVPLKLASHLSILMVWYSGKTEGIFCRGMM